MENASKALLIAGSILLFILLSSFASYMFTRARSRTTEIYGMMSSSNVDTGNTKSIPLILLIIAILSSKDFNGKFIPKFLHRSSS